MALFVFQGLDKAGGLELRKATRPAHLAWVGTLGERVKVGGPLLGEDGTTPVGSLIVIESETLDDAKATFVQDPYALAGLWGETSVRQFNWLLKP
jgi:uncharacterized protein YciI